MEHITYIGEVVEKLADHSSFPELFIKYEEGDPIPSGKAIHEIIELCRAVLFPGYYGNHTVNSQTLTFHLGVTLEKLSNILTQQIQAGMLFGKGNSLLPDGKKVCREVHTEPSRNEKGAGNGHSCSL